MTDSERARFELLLEDIKDKISLVAEGHGQLVVSMHRVEGRLDRIEADVAVLKADVAVLKADVAVLKTDMSSMTSRVTRIEKHLKLNGTTVRGRLSRKPRGRR